MRPVATCARVERQRCFENYLSSSVEAMAEDLVKHPVAEQSLSCALRGKASEMKRLIRRVSLVSDVEQVHHIACMAKGRRQQVELLL